MACGIVLWYGSAPCLQKRLHSRPGISTQPPQRPTSTLRTLATQSSPLLDARFKSTQDSNYTALLRGASIRATARQAQVLFLGARKTLVYSRLPARQRTTAPGTDFSPIALHWAYRSPPLHDSSTWTPEPLDAPRVPPPLPFSPIS